MVNQDRPGLQLEVIAGTITSCMLDDDQLWQSRNRSVFSLPSQAKPGRAPATGCTPLDCQQLRLYCGFRNKHRIIRYVSVTPQNIARLLCAAHHAINIYAICRLMMTPFYGENGVGTHAYNVPMNIIHCTLADYE